jgi:hypothetical protein
MNAVRELRMVKSRAEMVERPWLIAFGALEAAGVEFIDENGGGPGVRLRKSGHPRASK